MIYEAIPSHFTKLSIDLIGKLISAIAVYWGIVKKAVSLCTPKKIAKICPFLYVHVDGSDYNYIHVHIFSNDVIKFKWFTVYISFWAVLLYLHLPPRMKGDQCWWRMTGRSYHLLPQRLCHESWQEELHADFNLWEKCKAKMSYWKSLLNSINSIRETLYLGELLLLRQICRWRTFIWYLKSAHFHLQSFC